MRLFFRFYTLTKDWKLWLTSLLLPEVRCKIVGCLNVEEHKLLLEVSFVVTITVFRDDHLEQIYSKYL